MRTHFRGCPPTGGGGRTAGDWAAVDEWFAGMVSVAGRWWWGKPHPTGLYEHRRLHRGRYPLPSPPPLRASPCRGGGRTAGDWAVVGEWFAGMVGVSGRWWWGKPHPTSLYKHRRLYRERYPLPDPPPLRASPCRGGGRTTAGMRAVNVRAERCAEAHSMVVCWVTRCALTQPTEGGRR